MITTIDKAALDDMRTIAREQSTPTHGPELEVQCQRGLASLTPAVFGGLLLSVEGHGYGEEYREGRAVLTPAQCRELAAALLVMSEYAEE